MSYTAQDAHRDLGERAHAALERRNSEALRNIAYEVKKQGEDEYAEALLQSARRIDREDWAYDEAVDRQLEDNTY